MDHQSRSSLTRREVLRLGSAALAVGAASSVLAGPGPAEAQTPKRGGRFRLRSHVPPVHFDPHQTLVVRDHVPAVVRLQPSREGEGRPGGRAGT